MTVRAQCKMKMQKFVLESVAGQVHCLETGACLGKVRPSLTLGNARTATGRWPVATVSRDS